MKKIRLYQVDAFADRLFSGNPAAVCILDEWPSDVTMQSIAEENNLAETAFTVLKDDKIEIRWFTPTVEVDLCGHATLATAHVLFHCLGYKASELILNSPRSGVLKVSRRSDVLFLDFPADTLKPFYDIEQFRECIGILPSEAYLGKSDFVLVVESEEEILNLRPDFSAIARLQARGMAVTAKGSDVDFVSRFFAPQCGINEDPVTGSAHTSLTPLWSEKLGKTEMKARQLSKRGGKLLCINKGDRIMIGGQAQLYMTGEIEI